LIKEQIKNQVMLPKQKSPSPRRTARGHTDNEFLKNNEPKSEKRIIRTKSRSAHKNESVNDDNQV
jgi:hypothetical protein